MSMATFGDFMKLDIRVGTILEARVFEKARKHAYQLLVLITLDEEVANGDKLG